MILKFFFRQAACRSKRRNADTPLRGISVLILWSYKALNKKCIILNTGICPLFCHWYSYRFWVVLREGLPTLQQPFNLEGSGFISEIHSEAGRSPKLMSSAYPWVEIRFLLLDELSPKAKEFQTWWEVMEKLLFTCLPFLFTRYWWSKLQSVSVSTTNLFLSMTSCCLITANYYMSRGHSAIHNVSAHGLGNCCPWRMFRLQSLTIYYTVIFNEEIL